MARTVIVAETAGFCFGVSRAVELVEEAVKAGGRVATLGPIIHNRHVVAHFEALGVRELSAPEQAQDDDGDDDPAAAAAEAGVLIAHKNVTSYENWTRRSHSIV